MATKRRTPAAFALAVRFMVVIGIAAAIYLISARQYSPGTTIYIIPEGYIRWLHTQYDVPGEKELTVSDRDTTIRYSSDGVVKTSTIFHGGWSKDIYLVESRSHVLSHLPTEMGPWLQHISVYDGNSEHTFQWMYVGLKKAIPAPPDPK